MQTSINQDALIELRQRRDAFSLSTGFVEYNLLPAVRLRLRYTLRYVVSKNEPTQMLEILSVSCEQKMFGCFASTKDLFHYQSVIF